MDWAYLLAYVTGRVNEELLLRNEYLATENRILKAQLKGRVLLSDAERITLAEIGHRLGRKAFEEVAQLVRPDTILRWYRKLIARKFDGSKAWRTPGRPRVDPAMDEWGFLENCRYLIHDRDTKYCQSFRTVIESGGIKTVKLPARSPNLNAFSERWVRSIKDECLSKLIDTQQKLNGLQILPIELSHIYKLEKSPHYHNDPFDRLLIAQT